MRFADRLLTIVITVTLTSAFWIIAGDSLMSRWSPGSDPEEVETLPEASESDAPPDVSPSQPSSVDVSGTPTITGADTATLIIPVLDVQAEELVNSYSDARGGGERLHEAIDIMADSGTTVISASPGTIERLYKSDAGGNTIYVRSDDGRTIYYYAHLRDYAAGLRQGQKIRRGQRLGSVGSSGNADPEAPHLHFAIMRTTPDAKWWEPANAVNPYPILSGQAAQ